MASSYKVRETKNTYKMSYSGDLNEALEKARLDLEKRQSDPNMQHWEWLRDKATKEIESNNRAVERIKVFISAAERQIKEQEEKCE